MGRSQIEIPRFGIRLRASQPRVNHISYMVKPAIAEVKDDPRTWCGDEVEYCGSTTARNKVMVVVDPSLDSVGALEWTLSHTIPSHHDSIVLLQVIKTFSKEHSGKFSLRDHEVLQSMRSMCKSRRPSLKVEVVMVEGSNKGFAIVEEAKRQRVSMLVLGQRRRPTIWRLVRRWWTTWRQRGLGTVEYCIHNANCMSVAVRRKSRKAGGYLITTKRHKNFWLLA